jgi:hypothetical protein
LRLSGLGLEIHDNVLSESVFVTDLQHGKQLGEMCLGEFGIDGETDLGSLLCGSNDPALSPGYSFLCSGHVATFL